MLHVCEHEQSQSQTWLGRSHSSAWTGARRVAACVCATLMVRRSRKRPAPRPTFMWISLAAIDVMRGLIVEVRDSAGLDAGKNERIAIGFGLAGLNDAGDATKVCADFPGYALVRAANDATTACVGAHAGADGGLVIAGTGSAAIARVGGKETIIGGRGFALGDDGSGALIGLAALRAATRAYDRLGPSSALTVDMLGAFGDDIVAMVRWARKASLATMAPSRLGSSSTPPRAIRSLWRRRRCCGRDCGARARRGRPRRRSGSAGRRRRRSVAPLSGG